MINAKIVSLLNAKGSEVFTAPSPCYPYEDLFNGVRIGKRKLCVLSSNTYRGFHKENKEGSGAKIVFNNYFLSNKDKILQTINSLDSEIALNSFSNNLCKEIKTKLNKNIKSKQLNSYNKIRKPIDIVIEHVVSMAKEIDGGVREKIADFLFLPLDSQMFKSEIVFSEIELTSFNLKRSFTFKDITEADDYTRIQNFLKNKSLKTGLKHRIYFDLLWNCRFSSNGSNLFLTSS